MWNRIIILCCCRLGTVSLWKGLVSEIILNLSQDFNLTLKNSASVTTEPVARSATWCCWCTRLCSHCVSFGKHSTNLGYHKGQSCSRGSHAPVHCGAQTVSCCSQQWCCQASSVDCHETSCLSADIILYSKFSQTRVLSFSCTAPIWHYRKNIIMEQPQLDLGIEILGKTATVHWMTSPEMALSSYKNRLTVSTFCPFMQMEKVRWLVRLEIPVLLAYIFSLGSLTFF